MARFFCETIKLPQEMPKLPKMPKAVRPRGSRQVNVFYLFSRNKFTLPNPVMAIFQGGVISWQKIFYNIHMQSAS